MDKLVQLMGDVVAQVAIDDVSVWMTALINILPLIYLFGLVLLVYLLYRHLRTRHADEKRKNQ